MKSRSSSGFTLVEVTLASVLLAILAYKAYGVLNQVQQTSERENSELYLEDRARRVLRQIGWEVMSANFDSLRPTNVLPASSEDIRYQVNLGVQGGAIVWGDPEEIGLDTNMNQVLWRENPDEDNERRVVWTNLVAPFLEGEVPNGLDDNGNGLIDEQGLNFVLDGNSVRIRLTLQDMDRQGEFVQRTVETTVTCRNLSSGVDA